MLGSNLVPSCFEIYCQIVSCTPTGIALCTYVTCTFSIVWLSAFMAIPYVQKHKQHAMLCNLEPVMIEQFADDWILCVLG